MAYPRKTARRISVGIVLIVLAIAATVLMVQRSSAQFADTYTVYDAADAQYETAAYKPAVESNPIRAQVNQLLSRVLQEDMSPLERFELANRGIAHLNDIEGQIDAIKEEGDLVEPLVDELERQAKHPGNLRERAEMLEIVAIARERARIIGDIRGLSYRANFYSGEVFERIIDDQGELTPEHVQYLNDLIPQLEDQFDARAALYDELQKTGNRMNQLADSLQLSYGDRE